ncbi:serine/threonine kinase [Ordospora colligata]|uniref:Serine/threonine kinase n=1 Tax=Ordospora colligata OC4 TaxID=1354746 RepID=A0A0B2UHR1_9MICR|nr:serine/threonine kinase [Ordospora colligata OC4]KHN68863.1 serine/threonine kinase [Ordospora colligata OC4]TBU13897.1 serine/threonine kinase [Ordospora colligata]TBU14086.1 serine/threonine kinase [Ordospora colligata]TBU17755.1 serine/threonine kinase [Ordospora colligata]
MLEPEEGEIPVFQRFTQTSMEYEMIRTIGEGTFGQVILAKRNRAKYALKKVNRTEDGIPITTIREIQTLREMHHPNIIRLIEVVVDSGKIYMVFPYVQHDLNKFIRNKKMSTANIKHVFLQITKGICYMHSKGIMHRDLKSANILIDQNLNVSIADFGMARRTTKAGIYTPGMVTLWYRAPEILLGRPTYTYAVDVWSMGCVLVEMYLGSMLFQGSTEIAQLEMIIHACGSINEKTFPGIKDIAGINSFRLPQSPRRIESIIEKYDVSAVDIVSRMLCIDPCKRITADEALGNKYFSSDSSEVRFSHEKEQDTQYKRRCQNRENK